MAFMMPVVKNDWDIYKSNRSRRSSECSNPTTCRSRKVSESSKSDGPSLSTSPGSDFLGSSSPAHRSVPMNMASRQYSQVSSRDSASSLQSPGSHSRGRRCNSDGRLRAYSDSASQYNRYNSTNNTNTTKMVSR